MATKCSTRTDASHRMSRFYLTTAIDYVNSRPHLGTAYEKITRRRHRPLQAAGGFETRFVMGNDEHSQNVFRSARRSRGSIRWPTATRWSASSATAWDLLDVLVRRFHPHDAAAPQGRGAGAGAAHRREPATSTKASTRAGTASAARRSSRRRISSTASARCTAPVEWIKEKNHFFRLSKYRDSRCSSTSRRIPEFLEPDVRRNEILRLLEAGLEDISISRAGQSWGIPLPRRSRQRGLRLVRRADQLRVGRRLRHRRGAVRRTGGRPTCT